MKTWVAVAALWACVACSDAHDPADAGPRATPAAAPEPAACEVLADEIVVEGRRGLWESKLGVGPDAGVHVVWLDEGTVLAAHRDASGVWNTQPLLGVSFERLAIAAGGRAVSTMLLIDNLWNASTLWQWTSGSWVRRWEMITEQALNQSGTQLAISADGAAHFTVTQGDLAANHEERVELYLLARDAGTPLLDSVIPGRDPLLAVDEDGARHVLYREFDQRRLWYLAPDGATDTVFENVSGWPALAVSRDEVYAFVHDEDLTPWLLKRGTDDWQRIAFGSEIREECEQYPSYPVAADDVCNHVSLRYTRAVLAGGPRVVVLAQERHEEGPWRWDCSAVDLPCRWVIDERFVSRTRLVFATARPGGVGLTPIPIELPQPPDAWSFDLDQGQDGVLHLLIVQSTLAPNGDSLRYVRLGCADP